MIYAICIECDNRVAVDEEQARLGISGIMETTCTGDDRCRADDLSADYKVNDPRHVPYSNLRGK